MAYILSIDQSTSGTKAMLFNGQGELVRREDKAHRQIIDDCGYVEHDAEEIYKNVLAVCKKIISSDMVKPEEIKAISITNQRETVLAWDKKSGKPVYNAIVWQCGRAAALCDEIAECGKFIKERTGLVLSPYFSAPKAAWIIRNVSKAKQLMDCGELCIGTIDSWLLYRLTGGESFKTDYSNASRTMLMNLETLNWDVDILDIFGVSKFALPEICDSDSVFGYTDFDGIFSKKLPIIGVMGDSHSALFAQGCFSAGRAKVTFGTGSSIMMNVGEKQAVAGDGTVSCIGWRESGETTYVLEGNINYTGAVIKWLVDDIGLIESSKESGRLAQTVDSNHGVYLVPAFSGLGAPYWNDSARAIICGMDRTTKKAHVVRAAEESIAYQICDVVGALDKSFDGGVKELSADGGAVNDGFLMQFLSDVIQSEIKVSDLEELSGAGVAYMAMKKLGIAEIDKILSHRKVKTYKPQMDIEERNRLYNGWARAVGKAAREFA